MNHTEQEHQIFLGIGSNIEPQRHVAKVVQQIRDDYPRAEFSSLYQSPAVGFEGDDFLNLVVRISDHCALEHIFSYADRLEQAAGRMRVARGNFDARSLDVDLLLFGDLHGHYAGHDLPDPDILCFAHVLAPLAELAPQRQHPVLGTTLGELWAGFAQDNVQLTRLGPVSELACS
ncbi:MAG: 2-amino-4-hydroxy-6-hydroxymethyldihydropteridine diphosphokinase [Gammaproteobacteria bacterium]|nr:2-amino-4-hydroxy-6-hydroxymethyldihydropteridine diphosphokinase [Gammaproteobacteria bacterium]